MRSWLHNGKISLISYLVWASYLVMYLLLTECHQNDRDEEVQDDKGHEHNAGPNEESAEHWIVIQNLRDREESTH